VRLADQVVGGLDHAEHLPEDRFGGRWFALVRYGL
jgi:hypothetical protein